MTTKERIKHDISEAFDFLRYLIKNPKEIGKIEEGSEINIFCKDIPQKTSKHLNKRKTTAPSISYLSEHTFYRV
ncbi:MAG: hypothetical protein HYT97_02855 [Elusimicrobia bacterium]|nr:hypothetical protein [Elusimicrobiota bacterium]